MRTTGNMTDEKTDDGTEAFTGTQQEVDERGVDAASVGTDDPLVSAAASAAATPVEMPAPAQDESD